MTNSDSSMTQITTPLMPSYDELLAALAEVIERLKQGLPIEPVMLNPIDFGLAAEDRLSDEQRQRARDDFRAAERCLALRQTLEALRLFVWLERRLLRAA